VSHRTEQYSASKSRTGEQHGEIRLLLNIRDKVIIDRIITSGHTSLTHGYLMAKKEKPRCNTRGTELVVNYIIT